MRTREWFEFHIFEFIIGLIFPKVLLGKKDMGSVDTGDGVGSVIFGKCEASLPARSIESCSA